MPKSEKEKEEEKEKDKKEQTSPISNILRQRKVFSNKNNSGDTFQRDLIEMNFCTNASEQRNVGGLSKYFEHCKKRKMGEFVVKGRRSNFIIEIPAPPFFEFQIPEPAEEI